NVQSLTYCVLLIASLITAVIVAYVGIIGFIGMIIPQLVRRQGQQFNLGQQMVLNMFIGGIVMVMSDWLGSILLSPFEIPASIILHHDHSTTEHRINLRITIVSRWFIRYNDIY